ncbi:MAG TPA: glycosyltransferase [Candidatus Colwellbacteria bacterium]|nr:glycosyltransferase [Candidatus Colwellbacteria bacterium]
MKPLFSVIIPTYESGKSLPLALIGADKFLRESGFEYEIIVADAKSADQTADIVRRFSALVRNLDLVSGGTVGHRGKALQAAVEASAGESLVVVDPRAAKIGETLSRMSSAFTADKARIFDVFIPQGAKNRNRLAESLLEIKHGDLFSGIAGFRRGCGTQVFPKIRLPGPGAVWEPVVVAGQAGFKIKTVDTGGIVGEASSLNNFRGNLGPLIRVAYGLRRDVYRLKNKNN